MKAKKKTETNSVHAAPSEKQIYSTFTRAPRPTTSTRPQAKNGFTNLFDFSRRKGLCKKMNSQRGREAHPVRPQSHDVPQRERNDGCSRGTGIIWTDHKCAAPSEKLIRKSVWTSREERDMQKMNSQREHEAHSARPQSHEIPQREQTKFQLTGEATEREREREKKNPFLSISPIPTSCASRPNPTKQRAPEREIPDVPTNVVRAGVVSYDVIPASVPVEGGWSLQRRRPERRSWMAQQYPSHHTRSPFDKVRTW